MSATPEEVVKITNHIGDPELPDDVCSTHLNMSFYSRCWQGSRHRVQTDTGALTNNIHIELSSSGCHVLSVSSPTTSIGMWKTKTSGSCFRYYIFIGFRGDRHDSRQILGRTLLTSTFRPDCILEFYNNGAEGRNPLPLPIGKAGVRGKVLFILRFGGIKITREVWPARIFLLLHRQFPHNKALERRMATSKNGHKRPTPDFRKRGISPRKHGR